MKNDSVVRDIQRSNTFQERAMGLAVGSEAFVFNVLRKDLYSDPIGSLIREYTVNAQDEHRKHNKTDVPIAIQVPNHFQPELRIRDFAGGLTEEQVFNFFGNYGASDKRDSNVAVGFFGLGCKSAFAYTDSYIVKSFKDGMAYTFNIYIDETEIGKTARISAEPTTEPNGVEIIVPVKSFDINTFQSKVMSTVRYFKTKPVITGMAETPVFDTKIAKIKGEDWQYFGSGSPTVIMGEIPYPIDYYKMSPNLESWEQSLLRSEITINVNIGDVQVTASREALQMSPKTIQAIRTKLKSIKDAMVAEATRSFANVKNLIEAKTLYNTVFSNSGYSNIIKNSGAKIKWKGEEIDSNCIKFGQGTGNYCTTYFSTRSGMIKAEVSTNLWCGEDNVKIFFDDTDEREIGYKRRARTLLNDGARKVTIIHTNDVKGLEKILGMSVKELASYDAVTPTVAPSTRNGGTGVDLTKRTKHSSKVFVLNVKTLASRYYGSASEVWEIKEVDNLKGLYIPIDRFKPTMDRISSLDSLASVLSHAKDVGIDVDVPIYGIKKDGDTTGLTRFDTWLNAKLADNKELIRKCGLIKAYANYGLTDVSSLTVSALPDTSLAKKYATLYAEARKLHYDLGRSSTMRILNYSNIEVEPNKTVSDMSDEFIAKYPMLELVSSHHFAKERVTNYILEREQA